MAREFELAIEWLTDAAIVHKVNRCDIPYCVGSLAKF